MEHTDRYMTEKFIKCWVDLSIRINTCSCTTAMMAGVQNTEMTGFWRWLFKTSFTRITDGAFSAHTYLLTYLLPCYTQAWFGKHMFIAINRGNNFQQKAIIRGFTPQTEARRGRDSEEPAPFVSWWQKNLFNFDHKNNSTLIFVSISRLVIPLLFVWTATVQQPFYVLLRWDWHSSESRGSTVYLLFSLATLKTQLDQTRDPPLAANSPSSSHVHHNCVDIHIY